MITNIHYIKEFITNNRDKKVPYRWSHGATDFHLGDGLLIYSFIQFFKSKVCVCLGSGGGFIPRIMTQARLDLVDQEIYKSQKNPNWGEIGQTIIVDAANNIGGTVNWLEKDSFLMEQFHPRVINDTTENAYYNFFVKEDIKIDYLHIDADHSYEGVKLDFELYSKLMNDRGIISIHDTDISYAKNHIVPDEISIEDNYQSYATGPSKLISEIEDSWQKFDFFNEGLDKENPSSTGLTLLRKKL